MQDGWGEQNVWQQLFYIVLVSDTLRVGGYIPSAEINTREKVFLWLGWDFWWDFNHPSFFGSGIYHMCFTAEHWFLFPFPCCLWQADQLLVLLFGLFCTGGEVTSLHLFNWVIWKHPLLSSQPISIQHSMLLAQGWAVPCAKAVLGISFRRVREGVPQPPLSQAWPISGSRTALLLEDQTMLDMTSLLLY